MSANPAGAARSSANAATSLINLQNVVSVAMLSEGWGAKNVTHIMGLRGMALA